MEPDKTVIHARFSEYFGQSLATQFHRDGGPWKDERNLLNPGFKVSSLRAMHATFTKYAIGFTALLRDSAVKNPGSSVEMYKPMATVAADLISMAGFNYSLEASSSDGSYNQFMSSLYRSVDRITNPLLLFPYGATFLKWVGSGDFRVMDKVLYQVIDNRVAELQSGKRDPNRVPDLLDAMLVPDEEGRMLSREHMRNELAIFYFAGHETSATTMSWVIYVLAKHPEVYARVLDEVDAVLGGPDGSVVSPTAEQLEQLTYLDMVINEVLRLYPPVNNINRAIHETFELEGYIFPKGFMVNVSVMGIHHDPNIWPDPDRFDPERFSKNNPEVAGRHQMSFIPFAFGKRTCIGKTFFLHEAKTVLPTLLRVIKFDLDDTKESGRVTSISGLNKPNAVHVKMSLRS